MLQVIGRMLADQVYHGHLSAAGIMQIGEAVADAGPKMQKCASWLLRHARITIGGSGDNALEQTEDAAHLRRSIQGRHQMNFRGARIGEASVNPSGNERTYNTLRTIHLFG